MAATLDPELDALDQHLSDVWSRVVAQRQARAARRGAPPLIRLWDGDWNLRGRVAGELDYSFDWKYNDIGAGFVKLPYDHHLAQWALDIYGRDTDNIHITCDKDGGRWGGRMQTVTLVKNSDGSRYVEIKFLDDMKELEAVLCWPNPVLPAGVQFPKSFVLAGPARYTLKLTLFLNLIRLHGNFWNLPDDPLDPRTWFEGVTPWNWSIAVLPDSLLLDDSQWCVIDSRMKNFMELARPILADAGLMITTRRWLSGDPTPQGWLGPLRNGQLMVDIVDKSGVFEQTALGGTLAGGMTRTVTTMADNLVDDLITTVANPVEPAEYSVSKWFGTAPAQPWVVLRDGETSPVESGSWSWEPATVVQVTAGGKSAPGVNSALSIGVQFVGNMIGSVLLLDGVGGIADTALKPLYEDVFLAFGTIKSPLRTMKAGWSHYHEGWAEGAETAWSLSGVVAIREKFWNTRARSFHSVVMSEGPYVIGDQGQGHCWLGDRVGVLLEGMPHGRYNVEQICSLTLAGSRTSAPRWVTGTGDPRTDISPLARLLDQSRQVFEALKNLGVWSR